MLASGPWQISGFLSTSITMWPLHPLVPAGSPPRGGDVAVHVFDINQPSLPIPFYSLLVSIAFLSVCPFQLYFVP